MTIARRRPSRPSSALAALAAVALLIAACDGAGMMRTSDGHWLGQSPETVRDDAESTIEASADGELGDHWRCETRIAELPYRDSDDWSWRQASAQVDLVGDGQAPLPIAREEVVRAVRAYLERRTDNPRQRLTVTVAEVVDSARFARLAAAGAKHDRHAATAVATTPAPTSATASTLASGTPTAGTAPSTSAAPVTGNAPMATTAPTAGAAPRATAYIIQDGDTLAALSSVFYGSPQHWRRLVEANPGLDPAALPVGSTIAIPPAP